MKSRSEIKRDVTLLGGTIDDAYSIIKLHDRIRTLEEIIQKATERIELIYDTTPPSLREAVRASYGEIKAILEGK